MLRLSVIITWKCTYLLMTVKYWCCDVTVTCKSTEYERRTLGARGTAPHVMSVQRARTFSWSHVARASRGAAPFPCSPYLHWSSEQRTHLLQRHLKSPLQTILRQVLSVLRTATNTICRALLTGAHRCDPTDYTTALQLMITCQANVSRWLWLARLNCSEQANQPLVSLISPTLYERVGAKASRAPLLRIKQFNHSGQLTFCSQQCAFVALACCQKRYVSRFCEKMPDYRGTVSQQPQTVILTVYRYGSCG